MTPEDLELLREGSEETSPGSEESSEETSLSSEESQRFRRFE
jgi:hypothetical protein